MIGIICDESQKTSATEFFELFKTPWEFHVENEHYDIVVSAGDHAQTAPAAALTVIFGAHKRASDPCDVSELARDGSLTWIEHDGSKCPIYCGAAVLSPCPNPISRVAERREAVSGMFNHNGRKVVRVGYDLFDEVGFLLTQGQPIEAAGIPTLDIHIDLLRRWITDAGIPLIEIPPLPGGHRFGVCLTHDVDFIRLRDHGLDRSVLGFLGRAAIPTRLRDSASRIVWSRLVKNWRALLSLPGMYLGLCRDIWFDIDRYMELESGKRSTYFFIPRKDHPGHDPRGTVPALRSARYDVRNYRSLIDDLRRAGAEIGIHGIDAWHDASLGDHERRVISEVAGGERTGIRMHWLYFFERSPKLLEEAGFTYDSTLGYNETVGFRSGTTQVFRLPATSALLELPLNIMDTALFYPGRLRLSEADALESCKAVVDAMKAHGGVLTINWHTRSLNPERNWDLFFKELLRVLDKEDVWFATASEAVDWFRVRRAIRFERAHGERWNVKVRLPRNGAACPPGFVLRMHGERTSDVPLTEETAGGHNMSGDITREIEAPIQGGVVN